MPKEVRRLVFTHTETTEALLAYGEKNKVPFTKGKVIRATFGGATDFEFHTMRDYKSDIQEVYNVVGQNKSVIITLFEEITLEHKYYNITADFLSAALIEYCIAHKIMLPKSASKELDVTDFNVCMDIHFESYMPGDGSVLSLE